MQRHSLQVFRSSLQVTTAVKSMERRKLLILTAHIVLLRSSFSPVRNIFVIYFTHTDTIYVFTARHLLARVR